MKKLGEFVMTYRTMVLICNLILIATFFIVIFFVEYKCFADVIDDTLVEVGGEEFLIDNNSTDSSVNNLVDNSKKSDTKNGRIFIEKKFEGDNSLKISVYAEDVFSPVLGVSFHLKYESDKISFVKYDAGDFLESGGKPFYLVKNSPEKHKIYFGETLKKGDSFPTQGGKIVDFYFKISDYAKTGISDSNATIGKSGDTNDPDVSKILFSFSNGNVSTMDNGAEKISNIEFKNSEVNLSEKDGLSQTIASVFGNFDFMKNKLFLGVLLGMAIFGGVTLALFLAFKYGKKRA